MAHQKISARQKRKRRIRKSVFGTSERPRMTVFRGNRHLSVQIIDDTRHVTLTAASSLKTKQGANKVAAEGVGSLVAQQARAKNITAVVFDRNGYAYHGVIKQIADSARKAGLQF